MRRKGETLMEFVVALTVFGMITAGIFEFMANQTENLADIRKKDDLIYCAQVICNWTLNDVTDSNGNKVYNHSLLHNLNHDVIAGMEVTTYHYSGGNPLVTIDVANSPIRKIEREIVSFDWDKDTHILTVRKNNASMKFELKP